MNLKTIDLTVGIYDTEATITRHKNATVTIRAPFIKWVNNSGSLSFEKIHLSGLKAELAGDIFTDNAPMSYGEFVSEYLN